LPAPRGASGPPEPDAFASPFSPPITDTISAAYRQGNSIASVLDVIGRMPGNEPTPGYNPLDTLRGTSHAGDDLSMYVGSQNEGMTRAIMAQKDSEDYDRRTMAASGWPGVVGSVAAGLLDPTLFIPFMGELKAATAIGRALEFGAGAGLQETALRQSQVSRPWQESVGNVASSTILSGVLGAALGALSHGEQTAAAKALDEIRPRIDLATGALAPGHDTLMPVTSGLAQATGAAVSDTRTLEPIGILRMFPASAMPAQICGIM
jgi:hypothetical protein